MNEWAPVEKVRQGRDGTDRKGHEDRPKDVGFYSE